MRIYFLGPEGTNGHEAAARVRENLFTGAQLCPCATNGEAVKAFFAETEASIACVPIENSIQGAVTQTWDTLTTEIVSLPVYQRDGITDVGIQSALTMTIHHYPIYRDGTDFQTVKRVYSHPQALAQCQHHIAEAFPQAQTIAVNSTAEAVRVVASATSPDGVAIASRQAATLYGLACGERPIEDRAGNVTRFALIGRVESFTRTSEKERFVADNLVSICLRGVAHQPGGLVGALQPFANAGLNLARLESRPVGDQLGNYVFYVDVSMRGHLENRRHAVDEVMAQLRGRGVEVVILGTYPVYESD